jgi:hypothetical protein
LIETPLQPSNSRLSLSRASSLLQNNLLEHRASISDVAISETERRFSGSIPTRGLPITPAFLISAENRITKFLGGKQP